jgi:hypothetical protein
MINVNESVILICLNKIQFLIVRPSQYKKNPELTTEDFLYNTILTTLFVMQECLSV